MYFSMATNVWSGLSVTSLDVIPSCHVHDVFYQESPNHVIESLNMARSIMVAVHESTNIGICMT
jgi:hypothetical protein